jgi:hypothetical protein
MIIYIFNSWQHFPAPHITLTVFRLGLSLKASAARRGKLKWHKNLKNKQFKFLFLILSKKKHKLLIKCGNETL